MKTRLLPLLLFAILLGCKPEPKSEWTLWRGPQGNNLSTETAWNHEKLDSSHILWSKNIGWGHSAIAVRENHCYASGWHEIIENDDTLRQTTIVCLDLENGKEVWQYSYPSNKRSFPGPGSSPALDGQKLYQISWEGMLYCLDSRNGKELWKKDLAADSLTLRDDWGYNPSPVFHGELLLLNLNQNGIALNKNNGEVVWSSPVQVASYASVQLMQHQGQMLGIFQADSIIRFVDVATGIIVSQYTKNNQKSIHNDVLFTNDNKIFTSNGLLRFDGTTLQSLWQNDSVASSFRTGVIVDGFAYQFSDYKRKKDLYCVDLATGIPRWNADLGEWGSLMGTPGRLIVLTGLGKVLVVETNPDQFKVLAEMQVLPGEKKQENWCWTSPTLCNNKLLVRNSKGDIACIGL